MRKQSGMSLVELSISIAIVGILIASVVGGVALLKAAGIRKTVSQITEIEQALSEFEGQYGYKPGDMPTASSYWGTYSAGPPVVGASNGNGDGIVNAADVTANVADEDLFLWRHLALAELFAGSYTGNIIAAGQEYGIDVNAPGSESYDNAVFSVYNNVSGRYNTRGYLISVSAVSGTTGYPTEGFLTAKDAYSIDKKLDDGNASYGRVYGGRNPADLGCTTVSWTSASADYDLDAANKTCSMVYWIKKD